MQHPMEEMFDFDKAIPLEQFLEDQKGMAAAFTNDDEINYENIIEEGDI